MCPSTWFKAVCAANALASPPLPPRSTGRSFLKIRALVYLLYKVNREGTFKILYREH
jgi:hypothetical protein